MDNNNLRIRKGASTAKSPQTAAQELFDAIYQPDASFTLFYCSPDYDLESLGQEIRKRFGDTKIIGCTTAGEITPIGYLNGALTGVSIASEHLKVITARIDNLQQLEMAEAESVGARLVDELAQRGTPPSGQDTFGFLLIDGLSMQEEGAVSALYRGIGDIQLFGGSAGDGTRFKSTHIYHDGSFHQDAAVFNLFQTAHAFKVFKTQHFVASSEKMVVTQAEPAGRIVTEINGEPAGREYARAVGLDVDKLTPMIFATHPVVVQVGGNYYVRAIQKVNEDESLTFFCAIDEGIVLTVAKGVDLVENLENLFAQVSQEIGTPQLVLGCDCILRHLEIKDRGIQARVGEILVQNNVVGFATYGEQFNAMHVNQTFTGVAISSEVRDR